MEKLGLVIKQEAARILKDKLILDVVLLLEHFLENGIVIIISLMELSMVVLEIAYFLV